jgi:hypothetical protein
MGEFNRGRIRGKFKVLESRESDDVSVEKTFDFKEVKGHSTGYAASATC